jgi:hypothetical protein
LALKFTALFLSFYAFSGCAYKLGYGERSLPGGYDRLSIPVFKNQSEDVGIEVYFTDSLIREFERSRVARVTPSDEAPLVLEGTIEKLETDRSGLVTGGSSSEIANLPSNAVVATEYRLVIFVQLRLRRKSDRQIVWESAFKKEGVYLPPRVGFEGLNSANANYNKSARDQKISEIAEEMMEEAHDRMTENF